MYFKLIVMNFKVFLTYSRIKALQTTIKVKQFTYLYSLKLFWPTIVGIMVWDYKKLHIFLAGKGTTYKCHLSPLLGFGIFKFNLSAMEEILVRLY